MARRRPWPANPHHSLKLSEIEENSDGSTELRRTRRTGAPSWSDTQRLCICETEWDAVLFDPELRSRPLAIGPASKM